MNSTKKKVRFSKVFKASALSALASASLLTATSVKANDDTSSLSNPHSYSDLYASIIFSNGSEGSASSANLGYAQVSRYPAHDSTSGAGDRYGSISASPKDSSSEGVKLTRLFATYHDYSWLVSKPSQSDGPAFDRFMAFISNSVGDKAEDTALAFVLNNAVLGANLYEGADALIEMFQDFMLKLDIPTAFRLRTQLRNTGGETNQMFSYANKETVTSRGLFHDVIGNLLDALQVGPGFYTVIQNVIWTFLILGSVIAIMNAIRKAQMGQALTIFNRILIRAIVVILSIDGSAMIQSVVNQMSDTLSNNFQSPLDFSKSIVSDTLLWAGTQNLSFSTIGPVRGGGEASVGKVITEFKPTYDNVRKINDQSINIASTAQIDEYVDTSTKSSRQDATKFMKALMSQKVFSVNDYFKMINNMTDGVDTNVAAANWIDMTRTGITAGRNYRQERFADSGLPIGTGLFMLERAQADKMTEDEIETIKAAMLYYNAPNADGRDEYVEEAREFRYMTTGATSWAGANNVKFNAHNELILPYSTITPFSYKFVIWNDVESYIYGATTNNSNSTANYNNYIHGTGTLQNNNPTNGTDDFSNITELDGTRAGEAKPQDVKEEESYAKRRMNTNSLVVAINNRYAGISGYGDYKSLSTQSTAFLLQTKLRSDGLTYYGYNTAYSKSDKGTPKQGEGVTYVRYVIPNTGVADLMIRASMLGLIWIITGMSAIVALFYMLKAPVFSALMKMTISFFSAFFTGNLSALLEYLAYYAAISFSFAFARIAIYLSSNFGAYVITRLPNWLQSLLISGTAQTNPGAVATATINSTFDSTLAWPSLAVIAFALLMGFIMVWPIAEMRLGARNSRPRRVGFIGFIVMIPYMLAESVTEYLDAIHYRLYGKSKRQTFGSKFSNQVAAVDQGQLLKDSGLQAAKTAAELGLAVATGGTSAMLMTAGKKAIGGIASKLTGGVEEMVDENGNPIDEKGDVVGDLKDTKSGFAKFLNGEKSENGFGSKLRDGLTKTGLLGKTDNNLLDRYDEFKDQVVGGTLDKASNFGDWLNDQQNIAGLTDEELLDHQIKDAQYKDDVKEAKRRGDSVIDKPSLYNSEEDQAIADQLERERLSERLTGDKNHIDKLNKSISDSKEKPVTDYESSNIIDEPQSEYEQQVKPRQSRDVAEGDLEALKAAELHRLQYGDDYVEIENGRITKLYDDHPDNPNKKDEVALDINADVDSTDVQKAAAQILAQQLLAAHAAQRGLNLSDQEKDTKQPIKTDLISDDEPLNKQVEFDVRRDPFVDLSSDSISIDTDIKQPQQPIDVDARFRTPVDPVKVDDVEIDTQLKDDQKQIDITENVITRKDNNNERLNSEIETTQKVKTEVVRDNQNDINTQVEPFTQQVKVDQISTERVDTSSAKASTSQPATFEDKLLESSRQQEALLNVIGRHLVSQQPQVQPSTQQVQQQVQQQVPIQQSNTQSQVQQPQVIKESITQQVPISSPQAAQRIEELKLDPKFANKPEVKQAISEYESIAGSINNLEKRIEAALKVTNGDTNSQLYKDLISQRESLSRSANQAQQNILLQAAPQTGIQNLVEGIKAFANNQTNVGAFQRGAEQKIERRNVIETERQSLLKQGFKEDSKVVQEKTLQIDRLNREIEEAAKRIRSANDKLAVRNTAVKAVDTAKTLGAKGRDVLGNMSALANGRDHIMTKALKGELSSKSSSGDALSRSNDEANRRLEEIARTLEESNRLREAEMSESRYRDRDRY